jgi:hypothetical protein
LRQTVTTLILATAILVPYPPCAIA